MSEFAIIDRVLNMSHTIHSAKSLYKLTNTSKLRDGAIQNPVKDPRWGALEK